MRGISLSQSLYALGSGGFFGVGMGGSSQKDVLSAQKRTTTLSWRWWARSSAFGMTLIMVLFAMLFMRCYKIIMGQSDLRDRFRLSA